MKLRELKMGLKIMLLVVVIGLMSLSIHETRSEEQSIHVNHMKVSPTLVEAEAGASEIEPDVTETIPLTTFSLPATGGTVLAGETVIINQNITGNITVNGGTLILNDNYSITGTVSVTNGGSFEMSDGLITGSGRGVDVSGTGSTFKMSGKAVISGNTSGGVRISGSTSTFEMTGAAVIRNNTSGGVNISNSATFEMSGHAVIYDNSSSGVSVSDSATFEMTGNAVIRDSSSWGVSISGIGSTFEMTGDTLISNNNIDGVSVSNSARFDMTGNAVISGNTRDGARVTGIGSRFEMTGDAIISNNSTEGVSVNDSAKFEMTGDAVIRRNSSRGVSVMNSSTFEMTGDAVISNNTFMGVNITGSSTVKMSGHAVISGNNWEGVNVHSSSTFKMTGNAVISENSSTGVGVFTAAFEMSGDAVISDNREGVRVSNNGSRFEMTGNAVISENSSTGVGVFRSAAFEMSGDAVISENSSTGVSVSDIGSTFEMTGNAMISNNTGIDGGGVFVAHNGTFTAISGSIINNTTDGDGGGVYAESFEYADPLTDTSAYSSLRISEDVIFSGNTAGNGSFFPPANATTFLSNIETTSTSIAGISHPLNNDDINFRYGSPIVYHTVTFNLHGGGDEADFPTQTVLDGELADEPATNPTRAGYKFEGWFTSSTGTTTFDFATPITADTVIYAQWEEIMTGARDNYTVSFNLHGGTDEADFPTQTVLDGELADEPATSPTRTGYTFEGWFTSSTGNTVFDFAKTIIADTVIHAQWEEIMTDGEDTNESNNNNNNNNTQNRRLPATGAVAGSALGIGGAILIIGLVIANKKKLKD